MMSKAIVHGLEIYNDFNRARYGLLGVKQSLKSKEYQTNRQPPTTKS